MRLGTFSWRARFILSPLWRCVCCSAPQIVRYMQHCWTAFFANNKKDLSDRDLSISFYHYPSASHTPAIALKSLPDSPIIKTGMAESLSVITKSDKWLTANTKMMDHLTAVFLMAATLFWLQIAERNKTNLFNQHYKQRFHFHLSHSETVLPMLCRVLTAGWMLFLLLKLKTLLEENRLLEVTLRPSIIFLTIGAFWT